MGLIPWGCFFFRVTLYPGVGKVNSPWTFKSFA